jgi:hypothetical protein
MKGERIQKNNNDLQTTPLKTGGDLYYFHSDFILFRFIYFRLIIDTTPDLFVSWLCN